MQKILVLGASGMLGHKLFETLSTNPNYQVYGTVTSKESFNNKLPKHFSSFIIENVYVDELHNLKNLIKKLKPDVIINAIGIIKQKKNISVEQSIRANALFPQQISSICLTSGIRFITIGTDCVYDGQKKRSYIESDPPTCHDVYGMTKYLGEIHSGPHLTLRTSIIGHELKNSTSLVDWFINQKSGTVKGYKNAIFTGYPTVTLAKLISEKIIPNTELCGLYHISTDSISKFDLLTKINLQYQLNIKIIPDESIKINRALNSDLLLKKIGYIPSIWDILIKEMHSDFTKSLFYKFD